MPRPRASSVIVYTSAGWSAASRSQANVRPSRDIVKPTSLCSPITSCGVPARPRRSMGARKSFSRARSTVFTYTHFMSGENK